MFAEGRQGPVRDLLLAWAEDDPRVVAAAHTGSVAAGTDDRWSDVDLFFGVADTGFTEVLTEWTARMYDELRAVHHFDLGDGSRIYRAFLLEDGLEVDLGFTSGDNFGPLGDGPFKTVFGTPAERLFGEPDIGHILGLAWHHALHARVSIERNRPWQAEHWISALRNQTVTLQCVRRGLPHQNSKGADQLPRELQDQNARSFITSLRGEDLSRALTAAVEALLDEADGWAPETADRLRPLLRDWL